jgi:hypothetical protein
MDGFAVRAADTAGATAEAPLTLDVVDESRAGRPAERGVRPGEAILISTGAMVPQGADAVIRVEDTSPRDGRVEVSVVVAEGRNVRRAGEDVRPGAAVLQPRTRLGTARIAGIQAAKRAWELIPLAHPLPLDRVDVEATVDAADGVVVLSAEAAVTARTGVEMEAMTACSVAALTVYDMVKGLERGVTIERIALVSKSGGRSGEWRRGG